MGISWSKQVKGLELYPAYSKDATNITKFLSAFFPHHCSQHTLCVMNPSRTSCIFSNQTCVLPHKPVSRPFFLCGMSILLLSPTDFSCPSKLCSKGYLPFHPWSFLFTAFSIFFYNFHFFARLSQFCVILFIFIEVSLIYNIIQVPGVQQSDSQFLEVRVQL